MSRRAGNNVCLFCQLRRPRSLVYQHTPFGTAAHSSTSQAAATKDTSKPEPDSSIAPFTFQDLQRQLHLFSPTDVFRRRMLSIKSRYRRQSLVQSIEEQLNAIRPDQPGLDASSNSKAVSVSTESSHSQHPVINLMRFQLQSATSIEDFMRILTCHLQGPLDSHANAKAHLLATNPDLICTIKVQLSRFSLSRQLTIYGLLSSRLQAYGQHLPRALLLEAMIASAAVDDALPVFYHHLKTWLTSVEYHVPIEPASFSRIVTSLNFGLARIPDQVKRKRIPSILQLLYPSSSSDSYSLENFLGPNDIDSLGPWLATLVAIDANDHLHHEWELAQSNERWICPDHDPTKELNTKLHRNSLFINAFFRTHNPDQAWKVFQASTDIFTAAQQMPHPATHDIDTYGIHRSVWDALISNWSSKPPLSPTLQEALNQNLLNRLSDLCSRVEADLGVTWHETTDTTSGYHHIPWSRLMDGDHTTQTELPAFLHRALTSPEQTSASPVLKLLDSQLGQDSATAHGMTEPDALELALVKPWGFNSMAEVLRAFRSRSARRPPNAV